MKKSTIKAAFGGEVAFTKFISKDLDTSNRLLSSVNLSFEDGYTVTPEEHTDDDKRVDLVVRDSTGEVSLIIESQDATGWLDSIHASKVMYYMFDKKCEEGILLTEDATENIKNFVRYINENTPWNISLIATRVYELGQGNVFVDFVPLIRPSSIADKKIKRVSGDKVEFAYSSDLARIAEQNKGLFSHETKYYNSLNDVGGSGYNLVYGMNGAGHRVSVFHYGNKTDDKDFKDGFIQYAKNIGFDPKFRRDAAYIQINDELESIEIFKKTIDAIKDNTIPH